MVYHSPSKVLLEPLECHWARQQRAPENGTCGTRYLNRKLCILGAKERGVMRRRCGRESDIKMVMLGSGAGAADETVHKNLALGVTDEAVHGESGP